MARVESVRLVAQFGDIAYRVNAARKEPAVVKAAQQAGRDLDRARRSVQELAAEFGHAYATAHLRGRGRQAPVM